MKVQQKKPIQKELKQQLPYKQNVTTSKLSDKDLFYLDFSKISKHQLKILDRLSRLNPHRGVLKLLLSPYGERSEKQRYISENINFLSNKDSANFSIYRDIFQKKTYLIPSWAIMISTVSFFLVGLWRTPSRVSSAKYTLTGLTVGVVFSYGYWKYSMFQHHDNINQLVKKIVMEKYSIQSDIRF